MGEHLYGQVTLEETSYPTDNSTIIQAFNGKLRVPENRWKTATDSITLNFILLKAIGPSTGSPVVYLEGGPGASCTWQVEDPGQLSTWLPILQQRDLILLDQRGTGAHAQRMIWINEQPLPDDILVNAVVVNQHYQDMAVKALPDYEKRGLDPRAYTTQESAHDIEDLRQALGLEQITLMGFSYGSHLALRYLKQYEPMVEQAMFVGAEGMDDTYKLPLSMDTFFHQLSLRCGQDEAVRAYIPDLEVLYDEVIAQLSETPAVVEVQNPLTGASMPVSRRP
ncbi:MAG: alpha/beta hydrolase, partial [Bacteroidota bacterium]